MQWNPPPNRKTFEQNRWHALGLAAIAAVFAGGSTLLIRDGELIGWICLIFCALALPVLLVNVWRPTTVTFDEESMVVKQAFRSDECKWVDVTDVGIWAHRRGGLTLNRFVTLHLETPPSRWSDASAKLMKSGHVTIPSIGIDTDELLAVATEFWQLSRKASAPPPPISSHGPPLSRAERTAQSEPPW